MKKKKLAMLLAVALTFTQVAAVPVAAEDLAMYAVQEQEIVLEDDAADGMAEAYDDLVVEAETGTQNDIPEEIVVESDEDWAVEEETGTQEDIPTEAAEESNEDLIVESMEEVAEFSLDEDTEEALIALLSEVDDYYFFVEIEENGTNYVAVNSKYNFSTSLEDNEGNQISDYSITITPESGCEDMADYEVKGSEISVTTKNNSGTVKWNIEISTNEKKVKRTYEFYISDYIILPEHLVDTKGYTIDPGVGDGISIAEVTPKLFMCSDQDKPIDNENFRVILSLSDVCEYDWEYADNDTLYRINSDEVSLVFVAQQKDDQGEWTNITERKYTFAAVNDENNYDYQAEERKSGYALNVDLEPAENGCMPPKSHMTVMTDLINTKDGSEVKDYKLEILECPNSGCKVEVTNNGKYIEIESVDESGYYEYGYNEIIVSVQLPDGNGGYSEKYKKLISFEVSPYRIYPLGLDNLEVGESIDLSKVGFELREYKEENGKADFVQVDNSNIKFKVFNETIEGDLFRDYDVKGWELKEVEGQTLPIMTRKTNERTYFAVTALDITKPKDEQQIARTMYYFDPVEESHTHDWQEGEVTKEATCTETGIRVDTCVCGEKTEVTIPIKGHTKVTDAAVAATCTMDGKTEGSHCSECNRPLVAQQTIPAKGHTKVTDAAVAATCTTDGKTEGSHCSDCNTVLAAQQIIPAGHTEVKDAAVSATALKAGKTEGSHCAVCNTVLKPQNTVAKLKQKISLTAPSLVMRTGQTTTRFRATGFAAGDYVTKVVSSNKQIVKVENVKKNGTFTLNAGKKAGTATVSVYLASSKKAAQSFKITVQRGAVKTEKVTTTTKKLTLTKGKVYKKLASSVKVAPVTSKERITYSSSDKKVATVDSKGVIKARRVGTAKITIKSGKHETYVTVKVTGVKATKLTGVPKTKKIKKGKSFKINAAAAPKNTDDKITYKSSDETIVKVTKKGVVKGIKKGTATITVKCGSQKKECKVTVK